MFLSRTGSSATLKWFICNRRSMSKTTLHTLFLSYLDVWAPYVNNYFAHDSRIDSEFKNPLNLINFTTITFTVRPWPPRSVSTSSAQGLTALRTEIMNPYWLYKNARTVEKFFRRQESAPRLASIALDNSVQMPSQYSDLLPLSSHDPRYPCIV